MSNLNDFINVGANTGNFVGNITSTGNVQGNYVLGNGAQLDLNTYTAGNVVVNGENRGLVVDEGTNRRLGIVKYSGIDPVFAHSNNIPLRLGRVQSNNVLTGNAAIFVPEIVISTTNSITIGSNATTTSQGANTVAIGTNAGSNTQGINSVAIGLSAGSNTQSNNSIGIGAFAGSNNQGLQSVAIGFQSSFSNQGPRSVAIGSQVGYTNQGTESIALGYNAASNAQGNSSIAIGTSAGSNLQGINSVAIGVNAGLASQGANSVSIGINSGITSQGSNSIAIGNSAGGNSQGSSSIAIGRRAGANNQGSNSIAIGSLAGNISQSANSIVISAGNVEVNPTNAGFYVNPVRNDTGNVGNVVFFNTTTRELTYASQMNLSGNLGVSGNINLNAETTDSARILTTVSNVGNVSTMILEIGDDLDDTIILRHYLFSSNTRINMLTAQRSSNTEANVSVVGNLIASNQVFVGNRSLTNPPSFSARTTGYTVSIPSGFTQVAIIYGVVEWDTDGWYNNTNGRYNPQVAGYYQINGSARCATTTTSENVVSLRKNGSQIIATSGIGLYTGSVSGVVFLNGSTDYVDIAVSSGGAGSVDQLSGVCRFSGFRIY